MLLESGAAARDLGSLYVRFGSTADKASSSSPVCFTPKADKEQACRHVRLVPTADSCSSKLAFQSIILSARRWNDCGIVRPNALAVQTLITNSNFAGCVIGRSAGLEPFTIRPA
jgi:hypothetical protein